MVVICYDCLNETSRGLVIFRGTESCFDEEDNCSYCANFRRVMSLTTRGQNWIDRVRKWITMEDIEDA